MKTYEMVALANKDGRTYQNENIYYHRIEGFFDESCREWSAGNCIEYQGLKNFVNLDGWKTKLIKLTKEEQTVVDYFRLCGFKWITRDKNGDLFAHTHKPRKGESTWCLNNKAGLIRYDLPFIKWEDKEPYCI